MARWLAVASAVHGVEPTPKLVALLSSVIFFLACVTKLVALCAAHSNPQVRNRESEPEGELAAEARSRKLSQRFSPAAIQAKLSSFRKSSFRSNRSFRKSSFRINGSFRLDCISQVDVVDAVQKCQPAEDGNDESAGPAVWQRAILRGERCAPLEFSGLILYDENGNPLPLPNGAPPRQNLHSNLRPLRSVTT